MVSSEKHVAINPGNPGVCGLNPAWGWTDIGTNILVEAARAGKHGRGFAAAGNLKERGEELSAAVSVFDVGNQPVHGHAAAFETEETFERRRSLAA